MAPKIETINSLSMYSSDSIKEALSQESMSETLTEFCRFSPTNESQPQIPNFFIKNEPNCFSSKATALILQEALTLVSNSYLSLEDVHTLEQKFSKIQSEANSETGPNKTMSYFQYKQLRNLVPERISKHLSSLLFLQISGPNLHNIRPDDLFQRLEMIARCNIIFTELHSLDTTQSGSITSDQLKALITHHSKNIHDVQQQNEEFLHQYVTVITNRIFCILDPLNTQRININQLLLNQFFIYFVNFENFSDYESKNPAGVINVLSIISEFSFLDEDKDGLLTADDLSRMRNCQLLNVFKQRIIDYFSITDFKWFIRFRFAWDRLGESWANRYFFDLLDIDSDGYLGNFDINFFYKEMSREFDNKNHPDVHAPSLNSFINESFDMCHFTEHQISREQFESSYPIALLIRHLVDFQSFSSWELGNP